jgi:hypothetical protein
VVTSRQWDDYVSTIFGDGDPAATGIKSSLLAVPGSQQFLVYDNAYSWEPSASPMLPPDSSDSFEPQPGGHWVALDREGNVTSRFADWSEPE